MKNRRPIPDREFERRFFCEKNQFLTLLAQLHINRSEEHREMPSHYAKDTLLLATDSKSNLHPLRDAENRIMFMVTF